MKTKQRSSDSPGNWQPARRRWVEFTAALGLAILPMAGCASPEDGRPQGGGPGADGGNYRGKPIHAPSKIDGTKPLQNPFPRAPDAT
jgi:hypothetical protein